MFFSILLCQLNVLRAQASMVRWDLNNFHEARTAWKVQYWPAKTSNSAGLDISSSSWGASASVQATMFNWRKLYKGGVIQIGIFNCEPHHTTTPYTCTLTEPRGQWLGISWTLELYPLLSHILMLLLTKVMSVLSAWLSSFLYFIFKLWTVLLNNNFGSK